MAASKRSETLLYSAVGVVAVLIGLVALNFVLSFTKVRLDLTEEKAYTLSDGTRKILAKLDTPVTVRFYYSAGDPMMPVPLKTYAQRVEDLLREYKQVSGGKVRVEKYDPQPDSDAEDSAKLDGVEGQPLQTGDEIYLGLAVSCLDQKSAIPFLSPDRERLLEYDLTRAISGVAKTEKPVLGVLSSLPIFGQQMNPMMMMQMGRQQGGSPPWFIVNELKRDFTVKELQAPVEKIDDDINVLLVVHPKELPERAQFALDQFVLRGGKLIAFLDPRSTVDSRNSGGPMGGMGQSSSSTLGKLLDTWGIQFDTTKCVADLEYATMLRGPQGRPQPSPVVLSLTEAAADRDDVVTSQVDSLLMWCAGTFTGTPAEGLKQTVLLKSSPNSQLVDSFTAEMAGEQIQRDFKPSGREHPLAIRLTGKFKTAFPDGQPKAAPDPAADPAEKKAEEPKTDALKESKTDGAVILVGDADMLYDQFAVQVQEFFGQQIVIPRNANITLAQSMVEQLSGDSDLIAVRSRASLNRPFTLVKKIQAQAEENYRAKIKGLEDSLQEAQQRLGELQQNKEKGQRFILSPEQQKELENFRKKEAEVKRELKEVRKNLRQDIDALENRLKWVNIAGMPLLVTLTGISLAIMKRKRTAAR